MSEQARHTPGPWMAVRTHAYWEIIPENSGENEIPFAVGNVCSSCPGKPDGGLQEANARLIALTPELYAELKAACDNGGTMTNAMLIRSRALLKKATGGAQ